VTDPQRSTIELFKALATELSEKYGYSEAAIVALVKPEEHAIPATAFANNLTPFETVCRYLEQQGISQTHISKLLGRAPSVIKRTLEHSRDKQKGTLRVTNTPYTVPATLFADKSRTPATQLCTYLTQQYGLTQTQIAKLVGLNPRTVWTILHRGGKQ
jgi:DNA-binding transcriptional regulator LsrR (DeoR family)